MKYEEGAYIIDIYLQLLQVNDGLRPGRDGGKNEKYRPRSKVLMHFVLFDANCTYFIEFTKFNFFF